MLIAAEGPPGVRVPLTSGGTSYSVRDAVPTVAPEGVTTSAYVPELGRVRASTNAPPVPKDVLAPTSFPSGPTIDAIAVVKETDAIFRLTRSPAVPLKVSCAFCPGTVVVTVTDAAPGVIEPLTSGGTS